MSWRTLTIGFLCLAAALGGLILKHRNGLWIRASAPATSQRVEPKTPRPLPAVRVTTLLRARGMTRGKRVEDARWDLSPYKRSYISGPFAVLDRISRRADINGDAVLAARVADQREKLLDLVLALPEPGMQEIER